MADESKAPQSPESSKPELSGSSSSFINLQALDKMFRVYMVVEVAIIGALDLVLDEVGR